MLQTQSQYGPSISEDIRRELSTGEQVRWWGRPCQGIVLRGTDAFRWLGSGLAFCLPSAEIDRMARPLPMELMIHRAQALGLSVSKISRLIVWYENGPPTAPAEFQRQVTWR